MGVCYTLLGQEEAVGDTLIKQLHEESLCLAHALKGNFTHSSLC